jgi:tetratricopeptide (TPR) repeat protein
MPAPGLAQQGAEAELFKQARAYEDQQNYPAAEDLYRRVLASDPDNPEALKHLGILEQTDLKLDDSIETFKRVLSGHPDYPQVNFYLGLSYYAKHDFQNTIASLQREAKTPTAHPATRYYLALALEADDRNDDAIDQLNEAAVRNPKKPDVFFELARLHMAEALRAAGRLWSIDPDSYQYHMLMGEIYNQEGHYEAGIAQYQAALKKQPDAVGIHSPIGVAYFLLNQIEPAEKELLLAVQETPDDPIANFYLGNLELRAHQFTKALPYLKRAAELQPKNGENRILLGRCNLALG